MSYIRPQQKHTLPAVSQAELASLLAPIPKEFTLHLQRKAVKMDMKGRKEISVSSPGDLDDFYNMRLTYRDEHGLERNFNSDPGLLRRVCCLPFDLRIGSNRDALERTLIALAHNTDEVKLECQRLVSKIHCKYDMSRYTAPPSHFNLGAPHSSA